KDDSNDLIEGWVIDGDSTTVGDGNDKVSKWIPLKLEDNYQLKPDYLYSIKEIEVNDNKIVLYATERLENIIKMSDNPIELKPELDMYKINKSPYSPY